MIVCTKLSKEEIIVRSFKKPSDQLQIRFEMCKLGETKQNLPFLDVTCSLAKRSERMYTRK